MADPKILEKIRKCLALANCPGANEHEAARALAQAQTLMLEHGVTDAAVKASGLSEDRTPARAGRRSPSMPCTACCAAPRRVRTRVCITVSMGPKARGG